MADPRTYPRIPVQFHGSFSVAPTVWAQGTIVDLAAKGCRIESSILVQPLSYLQLILTASDLALPIRVDLGVVRWSKEGQMGIRFLVIRPQHQTRLQQLVARTAKGRQQEDVRSFIRACEVIHSKLAHGEKLTAEERVVIVFSARDLLKQLHVPSGSLL